jgi:hypothetical protein
MSCIAAIRPWQGASADLAHLQAEAQGFLAAAGLAHRARFVPTDFFAQIESAADCYLLKFIIHDWNDADSVEILRHMAAAAAARNAVVLIIERLAPERIEERDSNVGVIRADIQMMAANGGMEREMARRGR